MTRKLALRFLVVVVLSLLALTQLPVAATVNMMPLCSDVCAPDVSCDVICMDGAGGGINCRTYTDGHCVE